MTAEVELITVSQIVGNIRRRWLFCLASAGFVFLVGVLLAVLLPKKYEAEALIEVDWGMGAPQSSSAFEGSLVGSFLGNLNNSDLEIHRAVESVLTREFVSPFLHNNGLMPVLFHKYWNSESRSWEAPFDEAPPSALQGHSRFLQLIEVEIQPDTNFVSFVLRHRDPRAALNILERFIKDSNQYLHDREAIRSEKLLLAVERSLAKSQSQFIHDTMVQAFRSEVQKKVLLGLDSDLPFRIIDRPVLPESPSWPNTKLILALSVFFAFIIVLTIGLFDTSKDRRSEI